MMFAPLKILWKCLSNERGEVAIEPAAPNPVEPPWYQPAESLKTTDPEIWSVLEKRPEKDFPSFVKSAVSLEKKIGTSIVPPSKDAKPEEIAAFKQKIYATGAFTSPPESPDKYEIDLSKIPEPLRSDQTVKSVREWAHKFGVSQEGVNELVGIETKRYEEMDSAVKYDRAESEKIITGLAAKENMTLEEVMVYGGAWLAKNVSEQDMARLKVSGLADDPKLAWMIAKAGRDSGEDISITDAGQSDPLVDVKGELNTILGDKTHPYWVREHPGHEMAVEKVYQLHKQIHSGQVVD